MGGGIARRNFVKGKIFQGMDILRGAYVNAGKDGTVRTGLYDGRYPECSALQNLKKGPAPYIL